MPLFIEMRRGNKKMTDAVIRFFLQDEIENYEAALADKDAKIADNKVALADKDAIIAKKDKEIARLKAKLAARK